MRQNWSLVTFFCLSMLLVSAVSPTFSRQFDTCSFQIDPGADAFSDAAELVEIGLSTDDVRALIDSTARRGSVDANEFLSERGYDAESIDAFLSSDDNLALINRLTFSSPSVEILSAAYSLLSDYGLPSGALVELYPLTSDQQALIDNLLARGLSPEQAASFAVSALDLASRAREAGVFEYALTLDGDAVLDRFDITDFSLYDLSPYLNDNDALLEELLRRGVSEDEANTIAGDLGTLRDESGMDSMYLDTWMTDSAAYNLEYFGVPSDALLQMASLDPETAQACLELAGLDDELLDIALSQFSDYLYGDEDNFALLSPEVIFDVAMNDAALFAAEFGLTGDDLFELSALFDDPDALMAELMDVYGLSAEEADLLASEFENAVFADVFGEIPSEFTDILDEAIESVENGEYYFAEDIEALIEAEIIQFEDEFGNEEDPGDEGGEEDTGDGGGSEEDPDDGGGEEDTSDGGGGEEDTGDGDGGGEEDPGDGSGGEEDPGDGGGGEEDPGDGGGGEEDPGDGGGEEG